MAIVGSALLDKFIGHSEAETAFQPWWDTTEDFLVYGLIMLGLVAMPTTMFSSTPLDCTFCSKVAGNCKFMEDKEINGIPFQWAATNPGHNAWWVKKFCTMSDVDSFTLYFPYFLLIIPMFMVAIERGFIRIFKSGMKLETFYNLLVKEFTTSGAEKSRAPGENHVSNFIENRRDVLELSQKFLNKTNFYNSYLLRTILELVLASGLLAGLCGYGIPIFIEETNIGCNVYGVFYECAGHPIKFYLFLLIIAVVFLVIYGLCAFYALIWLCGPLNSLGKVMYSFRSANMESEAVKGGLTKYYFNNKDLKLLLDLLAESHGPATSLRVLSLFDTELNLSFKTRDIKLKQSPKYKREDSKNVAIDDGETFVQEEVEVYDLQVSFKNATAKEEILKHMNEMSFMYTIEIFPPTKKSSVIPVTFEEQQKQANVLEVDMAEKGNKESAGMRLTEMENNKTLFALEVTKEYTIRVNTVVNGKTLASKVESFGPLKKTE